MTQQLKIEYRDVGALVPYVRNTRTHSDSQVAELAESIKEFGFTNPVLVDGQNGLIAGHGRVMAAQKLGIKEVPVIELAHLAEAQKRAYVIADNKLAEKAGWNEELLALELGELAELGFDTSLTGFDEKEIANIIQAANGVQGLTDEDETPEAQEDCPVSALGDLWNLGGHRIVCGDSTDKTTVEHLLAGIVPHLMVTDPPYGVEYNPDWRNKALLNGKPLGAGATGTVLNDDKADWREVWELFPGDVAYVWHAGTMAHIVAESLLAAGYEVRAQIIWAKNSHNISRGHYHPQHEPCFYVVKKSKTGHWGGDRSQTTLWKINKETCDTGHGTQKPVECMRRPIENNSSPGQAVFEPFSGSGTTIIAAETTGRKCYAIELNPAYVDVAVKRWENFTGQQATLENDGRTFEEVAASRGVMLGE